MFHTFQTTTAAANQASSKNNPKTRRQASTTHACEECRRRKIRCDGKQPCSHCEWYKHPKLCKYSKKQPRVVPSQKLLDELSASLKQTRKIIEKLFPDDQDLGRLAQTPRAELVEIILSASTSAPSSSTSSSPLENAEYSLTRVQSDETGNLEALEQEPIQDANWDESKLEPDAVQRITDDVNALSMSVGRQSSYTGISSVAAAFKVMNKISTALESVVISAPLKPADAAKVDLPSRNVSETPSSIAQSALPELTMIDAYFAHVHPLIPMIDEIRFRRTFHAGERRDASWQALLNSVFAMGTIAASTADDNSHLTFYHKAMEFLSFETFGDGHIESLQALGLLGGYYLHYDNRPNSAAGIMGAALRMACALGLHREYAEEPSSESNMNQSRNAMLVPREVRRRTWWSLFCLDTWAGMTTGRPTLGRISNGVTVQPPNILAMSPSSSGAMSPSSSGAMSEDDVCVMVLCAEIGFCKIATRVQDKLAEQPLLPVEEVSRFDAELRNWFNNLPSIMKWPNECPERARVPRAIVSWWYNNLRIVLHRPMLLNNALRSSLDSNSDRSVSEDESRIVEVCRNVAGEAIASIRNQWVPNHMCGWNATWLLFQAAMVPLVTLFAEYNRSNWDAIKIAQEQIESVIQQMEKMERWSLTAKRSRDVVAKIYERHKGMDVARDVIKHRDQIRTEDESHQQNQHHNSQEPLGIYNNLSEATRDDRSNGHHTQPANYSPSQQHIRHEQLANGIPMQDEQMFEATEHSIPQPVPSFSPRPAQSPNQYLAQRHIFSLSPNQSHPHLHQHSTMPISHDTSMNHSNMSFFSSAPGIPEGSSLLMPQQNGLASHMGTGELASELTGSGAGGPGFESEAELNAFLNQIMWGEGEGMGFDMDMSGYGDEDMTSVGQHNGQGTTWGL